MLCIRLHLISELIFWQGRKYSKALKEEVEQELVNGIRILKVSWRILSLVPSCTLFTSIL